MHGCAKQARGQSTGAADEPSLAWSVRAAAETAGRLVKADAELRPRLRLSVSVSVSVSVSASLSFASCALFLGWKLSTIPRSDFSEGVSSLAGPRGFLVRTKNTQDLDSGTRVNLGFRLYSRFLMWTCTRRHYADVRMHPDGPDANSWWYW